jgi:iron complex outermembrane receptor protein
MEKLMIRYVLNTLGSFRSALAVGVGLPFLVAVSAYAQAPAPNTEATAERVIVTGTYIPTAEAESALPVTVYTAEVLQKAGANNPVEGLRQLPSFVGNASTENDSNGGNGSAGINLRGIGQQNTLILINGRRAFLGIGNNGAPDINAISIGAISRTEVLKDGASAIYGSDAVAGVVNFVMLDGPGEKPYEGAELYALYGNTTDTDAHVRQVYVRGGVTGLDGKVSIAASGEYYSRANLFSRDRPKVALSGNLTNQPTGMGWGGLNANSQTYSGRVAILAGGSSVGLATGQRTLINLSNNAPTPASYRSFTLGIDPDQFNFRAFTPAIPAQEMSKYFVTGRYKIFGEGLQLYGDIMYSNVKQDNGLAGSPFAVAGADAQASPFNPFGQNLSNVRYRTVTELGLRRSFFDHDYYRYTAGINGDFTIKDNGFISRFGYDSGFVYERYDEQRIDAGDAQFTPLAAEIAAGNFDPFIGQAAPTAGTAPTYAPGSLVSTGSAPYDNRAAALRASYLGHSFFFEHDFLYDAKINGHLFPGLWNGGIDVALGYEHRELRQHSVPDPVQANGDQLGFNQAPNFKTKQEVDSYFGEVGIPIITSTMNIPFVRSLDFQFAYRFEKFDDQDSYIKTNRSSFDNGGTPRLTLRYQPIADITLRASWGQSFLSPNPIQLFLPVTQNFPVVFDPRNPGATPGTFSPATLQPPSGVWQAGSTILVPEETDSYTAGIVWTPKFLPGFTMTVDWYQLYTTNLLLPAANAAQILLTTETLDPDGCGNGFVGDPDCQGGPANGITRDTDGSLLAIDADISNAGKRLVQGVDVTAVYELPTEHWGKFTWSGGYNHFFTWKAQPGVGPSHNFLGDFSAAFPLAPGSIPFNKAFLRQEWEWRHWDFIATGNYISDFEDDPTFIGTRGADTQVAIGGPGSDPVFFLHRRVTSYITLDMQLSYEWVKPAVEAPPTYAKDAKDSKNVMQTAADTSTIWQRMLWGTKLTVGVNNAFDRYPPSVIGAFNDNYDTSLYSIRNRYWYVSLTKKF